MGFNSEYMGTGVREDPRTGDGPRKSAVGAVQGNAELLRGYVASVPDRLRDVVAKEGGWTRFYL